MAILIYNGVELSLLKTNSVDRIARRSRDETEYLWTDFIISVTATYNPSVLATSYGPFGAQPGNLPMVTDAAIRHFLMQPRRPLLFQEGGIDILNIPPNLPGGGAIDCENGPIPQSCVINRIAGARLFYVSYVIKASIIECPVGTVVSVLASSRYSRTETIDEQYRSTMTVSGTAIFRSNVLSELAVDPDEFRGYLIPPQLLGYKRMNAQFSIWESGIGIDFSATDVEQMENIGSIELPGTPASVGITDMDLRYTTGVLPIGPQGFAGFQSYVSVTASAKAHRTAVGIDVVTLLIGMCVNKLGRTFRIGYLSSCRVSEDMFRKEYSVEMNFMVVPEDVGGAIGGGLGAVGEISNLKLPLRGYIGKNNDLLINLPAGGVNPQLPFDNGTRGTSGYMLAVSAFATACYTDITEVGIDETAVVVPPNSYSTEQSYGNGPSVQGLSPPPEPPETPDYRQPGKDQFRSYGDRDQNAYMEYNLRDDNITSTGIVQLPISSIPESGSLGNGSLGNGSLGNTSSASNGSSNGGSPGPWDDSWYQQPSCVNIRLFNPISRKRVEWSIVRVGCVPEAPDPKPVEGLQEQLTLLSRVVSPIGLELGPDCGVGVYRISGVYTYSLTRPFLDRDTLPFAIPPWVAVANYVSPETLEMQPGDYLQGIINQPAS